MVHQFTTKSNSTTRGIHKYKFHLPSEVIIYPEKGYGFKEAEGFYIPIVKVPKRKTTSPKVYPSKSKVYSKFSPYDPFETIPHELGHHIWYQLPKEDKDEFISALEGWWKSSELSKMTKSFYGDEPQNKRLEHMEYLGNPSEVFARFVSYYSHNIELPKGESKEAYEVFKKIMKKYNGNLRKRISKATEKISVGVLTKPEGEWREKVVSLRGI